MAFGIKKPKLTRDQSMAARPVHLVEGTLADAENGGAKLTVPLRQAGWSSWLFRLPEGAKKTFELDALGLLVWNACDGKTSVQQIIRKLAKAYNLNLREAEVATLAFLRMLAKKGLIGMSVKETQGRQGDKVTRRQGDKETGKPSRSDGAPCLLVPKSSCQDMKMNSMTSTNPHPPPGVQRQIVLPLSKAVEIAWKNIRMRLSRSLLVTSGIVLALAFLMSILTTEAITDSMRDWVSAGGAGSSAENVADRQQLERLMTAEGVPMTESDIAGSRMQTRWLLGLALLVAFVGILNAMLMSVTERFREIGTMKCLGALDSFIVKLFLLESLFQGIVGTVIGVFLGMLLSFASLAAAYGRYAWVDLPVSRLMGNVALALAVGIGLTVAGAVYPAWQAARMQPIEAMRVET